MMAFMNGPVANGAHDDETQLKPRAAGAIVKLGEFPQSTRHSFDDDPNETVIVGTTGPHRPLAPQGSREGFYGLSLRIDFWFP
jgi:hypothetical protein